MVFWIGILIAAVFVGLMVKFRLYETWAIAFNALMAVYLAIVLNPLVKNLLPESAKSSFDDAIVMLVLGIGFFALLHSIIYILVLSQFRINMGMILDTLGSAAIGFFLGLFVWSFILIVICSSPLSGNKYIKRIGITHENIHANILYISRCTGFIDYVVSSQSKSETGIPQFIESILKNYSATKTNSPELEESESRENTETPSEPNSINQKNEPNFIDMQSKNQLSHIRDSTISQII